MSLRDIIEGMVKDYIIERGIELSFLEMDAVVDGVVYWIMNDLNSVIDASIDATKGR